MPLQLPGAKSCARSLSGGRKARLPCGTFCSLRRPNKFDPSSVYADWALQGVDRGRPAAASSTGRAARWYAIGGERDEDKWRAGLSGENSNVLGPKNPGFTVFWTAGRAIAHEAEKQGVGRGEQCARASGQELTLNRQGAQGAHCAVRLRGAHWSVRGHRRPALRSARAHFERARGDKQRRSARRLPRPHLGRGATPSNYVFERHA